MRSIQKEKFLEELEYLKRSIEFSSGYPALAPMLRAPGMDPDVERILEGGAFNNALLRRKLSAALPQLIHQLTRLFFPHYLRPIPSMTLITFQPRPTLKQSLKIKAGTFISSKPVAGIPCIFQTRYNVHVHPIKLLSASRTGTHAITLTYTLTGLDLSEWHPKTIRFFLGDRYSDAVVLFQLLRTRLKGITLTSEETGQACHLSPDHLKPAGFSGEESLFPYPPQSFPGFCVLQEYFALPEKFLFFDVIGWEEWKQRGTGSRFTLRFEFSNLSHELPDIGPESFKLSTTPAVNIFPHDTDPINLDHRATEYPIRPSNDFTRYQVYSVEKVTGYDRDTGTERLYQPFEASRPESGPGSVSVGESHKRNPVYYTSFKNSPVQAGSDIWLSVIYSHDSPFPKSETLSIDLLCTNGSLPENITTGDICTTTEPSLDLELVEFKNIRPPTANFLPPADEKTLRHLLNLFTLNTASHTVTANLQSILKLHLFENTRSQSAGNTVLANRKRIDGITEVTFRNWEDLISGILMRGREIGIKVRHDHFTCEGDLYLFGCILDYFITASSSPNSCSLVIMDEILRGDQFQWGLERRP